MAKTKAEQRQIAVSTEYVAYEKLDRDAIYAAMECEPKSYYFVKDGVRIDVLAESKYRHSREVRLSGVKLSYRVDGREVHRKINVKDGHIDLAQVDRKIAELVALKAADEERSSIQKAEHDRATTEKQALKAEAEAAGLALGYYGVEPRPIVSWILQDDLKLAVDKHLGLSIGQAVQVQKLIESFSREGN
jgi:hypothetical protein